MNVGQVTELERPCRHTQDDGAADLFVTKHGVEWRSRPVDLRVADGVEWIRHVDFVWKHAREMAPDCIGELRDRRQGVTDGVGREDARSATVRDHPDVVAFEHGLPRERLPEVEDVLDFRP
jgi:hypothetical protein